MNREDAETQRWCATPIVIAGLDPAIHAPAAKSDVWGARISIAGNYNASCVSPMDRRVKPGDDNIA